MNIRTIKDKFRLLIKQKILLFFEGYMLRQRRNYILSLLTDKLPFLQSLTPEERKEIDEFWNPWIKGRNLFECDAGSGKVSDRRACIEDIIW